MGLNYSNKERDSENKKQLKSSLLQKVTEKELTLKNGISNKSINGINGINSRVVGHSMISIKCFDD